MQTKISKTLEGLIARTAFDTSKQGETRWLKDRLLLEIVREEGSLAYQLLSARLKDWELYQVRLRIERDLQERTDGRPEIPKSFTFSSRTSCANVIVLLPASLRPTPYMPSSATSRRSARTYWKCTTSRRPSSRTKSAA